MTRQILFVQGGGAGAHDDWDNHLVDDLQRRLGPDYAIRYPHMPKEDEPDYARWSQALASEFASLANGAILIAHSLGATVLINAIATTPPKFQPAGIFLLSAPFIGQGGWPSDEITENPHLGAALPKGVPVYLYQGSDDETAPPIHADLYAKAIPQATVRRLKGRDHQLNNDLEAVATDILNLR